MSEKRLEEATTSQNDINRKLDEMQAGLDALSHEIKELKSELDNMERLQKAHGIRLRNITDDLEILELDLEKPSRKGSLYKHYADFIAVILADRTKQGSGWISRTEIADILLGKPIEIGVHSTPGDRQQEHKRRQRWLNRFMNYLKTHPEIFHVERDPYDKRKIIVYLNRTYFRNHSELLTEFAFSKLQPAIFRKIQTRRQL
jgi:hypothetical protein